MKKLTGKRYGELSQEQKDSLLISGIYPDMNKIEIGEFEITVDFYNGKSVPGKLIVTKDEVEIVIDDEAVIYDPAE